MTKNNKPIYEIEDDEFGRLIVKMTKSPFKNVTIAFCRIQIGGTPGDSIQEDAINEKLNIKFQYNILTVPDESMWDKINFVKLEKMLGVVLDDFMKNHWNKIPIGNPYADLEDDTTEIIEIPEAG